MREKIEMVKELISIAEDNDLAELSVDFKGIKVEVRKEKYAPAPQMVAMGMPGMMAPVAGGQVSEKVACDKASDIPENAVAVKSPLSGVFYRAPKPGAPPFVNVGDSVEAGQALCIVEAMKLMNEIASDVKGKVVAICVDNAQVANEGEVLMYIQPE